MMSIWAIYAIVAMLILIVGSAIISEGVDEHYQYIGVASLLQNAANDYTEVLLDTGEAGTNSGVAVITVSLLPEFAPNAFGKRSHGATCWDVKSWYMTTGASVIAEAGQTNTQTIGIHSQVAVRTTPPGVHAADAGPVPPMQLTAKTITGAAGEVVQLDKQFEKIDMPQERFPDGNSFHNLLTKGRYSLYIDGTGNPAVTNVRFGMWARRVTVPLNELFFDRDTIEGLLDAVVLEAILG